MHLQAFVIPSEPYLLEQVNSLAFVAVRVPVEEPVSIVLESTACLLASVLIKVSKSSDLEDMTVPAHSYTVDVLYKISNVEYHGLGNKLTPSDLLRG